jgi:hypothetical protein
MPYNPIPSALSIADFSMVMDWERAPPGKWFTGIIDTSRSLVYIVPSSIHAHGQLNLTNNQPRQMNRYASGAPGEGRGSEGVDYEAFRDGNWLYSDPGTPAHHPKVCEHYNLDLSSCVGFAVIKVAHKFGQLKLSSASLHLPLVGLYGARRNHNFSVQTYHNRPGFFPGTPQMPDVWRTALEQFLTGFPLNIFHLAVSQD